MGKKLLSVLLAMCLVVSTMAVGFVAVDAATVDTEQVGASQYAQSSVSGGAILHCFNWSYNNIKANLADIQAAGYTAVQTSPVQAPKDYNSSYTNTYTGSYNGQWWKLYQPLGFSIADGNTWLGTKAELQSLCTEADKYGISVIVDIVANHLANNGSDGGTYSYLSSAVESDLKVSSYYHSSNEWVSDDSRDTVTQRHIGMPDLNTYESYIQNRVKNLLVECIGLGVDGFRFDAAKHIELPEAYEVGSYHSDFWPTVINGAKAAKSDVFVYGEILGTPANGVSRSIYFPYMAVTDDNYGNTKLVAAQNKDVSSLGNFTYSENDYDASNYVVWAESHDTFIDDYKASTIPDDSDIIKTWAIVGSRNKSTSLFLARPNTVMGQASTDTTWKSTAVSEINKFKNYFDGQSEYVSSSSGSGSSSGVTLSAGSTVYLNPGVWNKDGARYAIYVYGTSGYKWASMTLSSGTTYKATIPSGTWSNIIFCRMNGSTTTNSWENMWNQTADLDLTSGDTYTISGWDNGTDGKSGGSWSTTSSSSSSGSTTTSSNAAYVVRGTSGICISKPDGAGQLSMNISATGMADGTYTDQITGNTFKVTSGTITGTVGDTGVAVVYNPASEQPTTSSSEEPTTVANEYEDGYYLIKNDWTLSGVDADDLFTANTESEGEYMLTTTLASGDQIKVVKVENDEITAWYPDGYDTEYTVDAAHAGEKTIYFNPNGNGYWTDFGGYFWMGSNYTLEDGYYLMSGNETTDDLTADAKFTENSSNAGEYMIDATLTENQQIMVVKVENDSITANYPVGSYTVDAAHAGEKTIYFKPEYQQSWNAFGGYFWIDANPYDLEDGYYFVYGDTDLYSNPEEAFKLSANPATSGEYMAQINLTNGKGFYFVKIADGAVTETYNNNGQNYSLDKAHSGNKTVYFNPSGNSSWTEFDQYVYIEAAYDFEDGYYLVINDDQDNLIMFEENSENPGEYMADATLAAGDDVYVEKIVKDEVMDYYPDDSYYTVDADHAGEKTVYFNPEGNDSWSEFGGYFYIPANVSYEFENGYYLLKNDISADGLNADNKLVVNPDDETEYMIETTLAVDDEVKIVKVENDEITAWYPDGEDTQYVVDAAHAGEKTLYFMNTYQSGWAIFGGYFYISPNTEFQFDNGYYLLKNDISVTGLNAANILTENTENQGEYMIDVTLAANDEIKVVKVVNDEITDWYPDGYDTQYVVDADHAGEKTIYFKPSYQQDWEDFGGYFYIDANAQPNPYAEVKFSQLSISLTGDIGLNFYVYIPSDLAASADEDFYVLFSGAPYSTPLKVTLAQAKKSTTLDNTYIFTAPVYATQMTDTVTAKLYSGDTQIAQAASSVKEYAEYQINNASSSERLKTLCKTMLTYGSAAQTNFNHNTDNLADESIKDTFSLPTISRDDITAHYAAGSEYSRFGISVTGCTLVTKSTTSLRIKFKVTDQSLFAGSIFFFGSKSATPVLESGNSYYVEYTGIAANDLSNPYSLLMVNTSTGANTTLTYSANDYVRSVLKNSSDEKLINLATALYCYNQAAVSYFSEI